MDADAQSNQQGMMLRLEQLRRAGQPTGPTPLAAWTPEFWAGLRAGNALTAFLRTSQAASTRSSYASRQLQYQRFCDLLGMPSADACFHVDTLAAWVMGRSQYGYKLSTIELGVHAVCLLAQQHGRYLSCRAGPLRAALQAAARRPGSGPVRKQPILLPTLLQLCDVDTACWRDVRDAAFYVLGWHGMLRGAEVAALQWTDVSVEEEGVVLLVRESKTDQAGQGQFVFLHSHADARVCPLRCLHRLSCLSPVGTLQGPIFKPNQYSQQGLQKSTMLTRLHCRLQSLGLPSPLFGLHSLRSGGATAAAQQQVPERLIKVHGRWRSDTVRLYTCAVPEDRWAASAAMGRLTAACAQPQL